MRFSRFCHFHPGPDLGPILDPPGVCFGSLLAPKIAEERSKRLTGGENKRPEDRTIAKRCPRGLQDAIWSHLGVILEPSRGPFWSHFGINWGAFGFAFCFAFYSAFCSVLCCALCSALCSALRSAFCSAMLLCTVATCSCPALCYTLRSTFLLLFCSALCSAFRSAFCSALCSAFFFWCAATPTSARASSSRDEMRCPRL